MPYFIKPVEEDQCVLLTYQGEVPPIEMVAVRYEANALLAAKHWNQMVVDVSALQTTPTAWELFKFASGLSSDLPRDARLALVVRPEQTKHAKLIERVARNDGISLFCFFSIEEATVWVKRGILCEHVRTDASVRAR